MDTIWTKYYKDIAPSDASYTDLTLYEALKKSCEEHKDAVALQHGRRKFTYSELLECTDITASALSSTGLSKGNTLALCVSGIPATVFSIYAASKLGVPVAMLNAKFGPDGFKRFCNTTGATVAVMTADLLASCVSVLEETSVRTVIVARYTDYFAFHDRIKNSIRNLSALDSVKYNRMNLPSEMRILKLRDLMEEHSGDDLPNQAEVSVDSDALYFGNGAATGKVMVAALSSRAVNTQSSMDSFLLGNEKGRVLPLIDRSFSCGFCLAVHSVLISGSTLLLYAGDISKFPVEALLVYKPDVVIAYPGLLMQMIERLKTMPVNLSFLKRVISCGAVMNIGQNYELKSFLKLHSPGTAIERIYGMDETGSVYIYNPEGLNNNRIFGIPIPGVMVKIMDADSEREMSPGEMGEICVCTPSAMSGYKDDDGSGERVIKRFKDGRTWILTGDLGHADEKGFIYFDGNSKNIFQRDDVIVYPYIIEECLVGVDGVKEACVVDVERQGKTYLAAVIVPEDEYLFDAGKLDSLKLALESECELVFAAPMRPDGFEFRAYLPKENFGRNDHEALKKQLNEKYRMPDEKDDLDDEIDEEIENSDDLFN
ncbi:MAG: acyl--CoA ligase [Saccharofermentans sp.]|nr:acyl--CoA ligase [Saccharofermentans sp.]